MPIRGSPNGANHLRPQAGRDRLEQVVAINRNAWSQSIGTTGRNHPVRAAERARLNKLQNHWLPQFARPRTWAHWGRSRPEQLGEGGCWVTLR